MFVLPLHSSRHLVCHVVYFTDFEKYGLPTSQVYKNVKFSQSTRIFSIMLDIVKHELTSRIPLMNEYAMNSVKEGHVKISFTTKDNRQSTSVSLRMHH